MEGAVMMIDYGLDSTVFRVLPEAEVGDREITQRQLVFLNNLARERQIPTDLWHDVAEVAGGAQHLTVRQASAAIDMLLGSPRRAAEPETADPVTEAGMYRTPDGTIYKVQVAVHGSGRLYAKRLVVIEPDCGGCANGEPCEAECQWTTEFQYAPGALRHLTADMRLTLEQAKEFGALYGTCCVCGRTLTNEVSIEAGIGPVCAGRL